MYNRNESADESKILELACYVRQEQLSILDLPKMAVFEGRIQWSRLPWGSNSQYRDKSRFRLDQSREGANDMSSSGLAAISDVNDSNIEWKEAVAPDGRVYYW